MSISLKSVLILAGIGAFALIVLALIQSQGSYISPVQEIELMILALITTTAAGALYVGEKLGGK